jgi:hypothetical protein
VKLLPVVVVVVVVSRLQAPSHSWSVVVLPTVRAYPAACFKSQAIVSAR